LPPERKTVILQLTAPRDRDFAAVHRGRRRERHRGPLHLAVGQGLYRIWADGQRSSRLLALDHQLEGDGMIVLVDTNPLSAKSRLRRQQHHGH
jgi:hypothetical protein